MFKSGELAGCIANSMSQLTTEYSARQSAILLPNFPGFGWGGALSSWIRILICSQAGQLPKIAGKRLSIIISFVSFCLTDTDLVSRVPAARFFDVRFAGTCSTKNQVPIFAFHQTPVTGSWRRRVMAVRHIAFSMWFLCLHKRSGGTSPGTKMKLVTFWER